MISNGHSRPIAAVTHPTHPFYTVFIVALLIVSFPIKNLAYIAPLVYLAYQTCRGDRRLIARVSGVSLLALLISSFALLGDSYYGQVNVPGMFLAIVTYLPLIIAVCHPPIADLSEGVIERLQTTCAWFVIIQSAIGVLQFGMCGNPDTVCGTFGLLDFRQETVTIAQVYFTFTMFAMLLFMLLDAKRRLIQVALGVGLLTCILAQSGHQTIFLIATLGLFGLSRVTQPKVAVASLALIVVMAGLVQVMYPETMTLAIAWREKVLDTSSPKRIVVEAGLDLMADPATLVFGTGLGQFSSRAALITSNEYMSAKLPDVLTGKSAYFAQHIEPANELFMEYGEGSAISKPYCSLLSVCVETGLVGFLLLGGAFVVHLFRNVRLMHCTHPWASLCGLLANVGIVFFVLCCAVENYAEFAQAIFLPVLLYIGATSWAMTLSELQVPGMAVASCLDDEPAESTGELDRPPTAAHDDHALVIATLMRPTGETGVQTHTNTFLDYLAMQGMRPLCITPFSSSKLVVYPVFAMRSLLDLLRCREASVWWYRYWHYAFLKRALRRLVSDGRPRVIYAQDPVAAAAALETRTTQHQRVAMVVHFNVSQAEEWAEKGMLRKGGRYYESIRRFERTTLPRLDGIVFVSAFMQEALTRTVPDLAHVPSIVVPNFVSEPPLEPRRPTRDLISIGTLEHRKNQEYLIRVLAAAKDLGRRPSLTIVGDGPEWNRLRTLSKELGVAEQINFAGFQANAADMISDHRIYCHASRMENFSITLIEAMSRGVPVVAAPVGGVPEAFDAGTEGLHWDLNDPQGGARQVLRLLDDTTLRERIGEAALRRFQRCFRTDVVAHRLQQFLLGLIAEPSLDPSCRGASA